MRTFLLSIVLMLAACGGVENEEATDEALGETTSEATASGCWTSGSYTYQGSTCFTRAQMQHRAYNYCRNLYGACAQGSVWGIGSCPSGGYWKWGYSCVRCDSCPY